MFRCDQCDNAITPGEGCPFCGASAESQAPLPGEVLVIDMQSKGFSVLRGNHVHTCPECSTQVPCEEACGCFEDMRLEDGTERGGFVVCEECRLTTTSQEWDALLAAYAEDLPAPSGGKD